MADRTIKPDDTNDLVLQNNDGSAKIEVNEAQNIILTGGSATALTIDSSGDATFGQDVNLGSDATGTFKGTIDTSATGFGLITHASQWRITSSVEGTTDTYFTSNWEEADVRGAGKIGASFSAPASGVFTFPATGIWLIRFIVTVGTAGADSAALAAIVQVTEDDASFVNGGFTYTNALRDGESNVYSGNVAEYIFDVTSTSTHKVRFNVNSGGSVDVLGSSSQQYTGVTFIRLGDN